jgi:threonine dehydratase
VGESRVRVGAEDLRLARTRLAGVVHPTPVEPSEALGELAHRTVLLKGEHRQRTGSFKLRGAYNFLARRAALGPLPEVVAASAGNHGQGVALAARLLGTKATIFMPVEAPIVKVEAARGYGAEVRLGGDAVDDCIEAAEAYASATGALVVPPFDDLAVIAGQGTVGLEIAEQAPDAEVVVVPVGGGGLVSGVAAALREAGHRARVVGVQAAGAAAVVASLRAGRPVSLEHLSTVADGIAVRRPSELTLAHIKALVDEVVTVEDADVSHAMLVLSEREKTVVEPAGAVGVAALLRGLVPGGGPVVIVLSGGNVDPFAYALLLEHGLSAAGRFLELRVVLEDRPGALAALAAAVADLRLNVLSVEHRRRSPAVAPGEAEVRLVVETRDPAHRHEVAGELALRGFRLLGDRPRSSSGG